MQFQISCGCTSVDYSEEPIRPGNSISLNVTYKADHPEHFDKNHNCRLQCSVFPYCFANNRYSPIEKELQMGDKK